MKSVLSLISPKSILFFAAYIIFLSGSLFAGEASCNGITDGQTHYGTISGVCWAYHCVGGMHKLGSVSSSYCQACPSGQVKYSPQGTCNTCMQTCCANGSWSGCNTECPDPSDCPSSQCWNGSKCTEKPTGLQYNGKCYYTCNSWTCNKGSGWTCTSKTPKKKQKGTWTTWGDIQYSSKPSSTCSYRATSYLSPSSYGASDSLAITICSKHINGSAGIPDGTMTWTGSCTVVGNCWCVTYGGSSTGTSGYCGTGQYKCQIRTVKCWEEEDAC